MPRGATDSIPDATTGAARGTTSPPSLARVLGPWAAASIVVGTMLGTGVFIVPATMAREVGSAAGVMLVWVAGGLLAIAGALTFAELAAALPRAGGEYAFLRYAYGDRVAFLYGWSYSVLIGPCSRATIAAGLLQFAGHLAPALGAAMVTLPIPGAGPGGLAITGAQIGAATAVLAVAGVNYLGVRLGATIQVALTAVKVAVLVAVVAIGLAAVAGAFGLPASIASGAPRAPASTPLTAAGLFAGLVATLWAYDGWNNLTMVGSEIADPQRSMPRALAGGVGAVVVIYLLVNGVCFLAIPVERVAAATSVVSDLVQSAIGPGVAVWITLAMMVSALGSLNSDVLTGARVPWALARDGLFFRVVARVSPRFRTPGGALALQAVIAAALALTGRFEDLYSLFVFSQWLFYGLTASAVIALRRREPALERPYRTWGYPFVPALFVVSCGAVGVSLILARPARSAIGFAVILLGLPIYRFFRGRDPVNRDRA